jgi:hypothetical protein
MAQPDPLEEASNPSTDPRRLRQLVDIGYDAVRRTALMNPSLPEDVWRKALLDGNPEVWANPMAPFYLIAWTPIKDDPFPLEWGARWATERLWREPKRCSPEGKALLAAKVQEWWATSESDFHMMQILGWWAQAKGNGSVEHRETVRITVLCVRTILDLTPQDRRALDLLEVWTAGGVDQPKEAYALAYSVAVKNACQLAGDSSQSPIYLISNLLGSVERTAGTQAKAKHSRLLADLIRREMPLPPVVD